MAMRYDPVMCMMVPENGTNVNDKAINVCDASVEDVNKIASDFGAKAKMALRRVKSASTKEAIRSEVTKVESDQNKAIASIESIKDAIMKECNSAIDNIKKSYKDFDGPAFEKYQSIDGR